jgi:hypothetical protein
MMVSTFVVLVVIGVVHLTDGNIQPTSKVLLKVGAAGVSICYALLALFTYCSLRLPRISGVKAYSTGTKACPSPVYDFATNNKYSCYTELRLLYHLLQFV